MIDAELVRDLVRDQHPDLADQRITHAATGWDNELWRLGDRLAVRLPHATERASDLLLKEHRWLPGVAPGLPLPVPTPIRLGRPSARFPQHWTVVEWVPGEPADRTPITRHTAADTLAGFLRALHQVAPDDAPTNPGRSVPLKALAPDEVPAAVQHVWDEAVAAPDWTGPPTWIHGDLHPANVVVDDGELAGVIDFGEFCAGDPAADLCAAWLLLPDGAAARFFDAYGDADEAMVQRARGWVILRALALIAIGRAGEQGLPGGKPTWGPAGQRALDRLTS